MLTRIYSIPIPNSRICPSATTLRQVRSFGDPVQSRDEGTNFRPTPLKPVLVGMTEVPHLQPLRLLNTVNNGFMGRHKISRELDKYFRMTQSLGTRQAKRPASGRPFRYATIRSCQPNRFRAKIRRDSGGIGRLVQPIFQVSNFEDSLTT